MTLCGVIVHWQAGQLNMAGATAKHGVLMASPKASLHHQHRAAAAARLQLSGREHSTSVGLNALRSARCPLSLASRPQGSPNSRVSQRPTMALGASAAAINAAVVDRTIEIKITIARGTGKLDLTELDTPLTEIPSEVFELTELTVRLYAIAQCLFIKQ